MSEEHESPERNWEDAPSLTQDNQVVKETGLITPRRKASWVRIPLLLPT